MSAVTEVAAQAHAERVVPRAATRRRERRRRAGRIAWNVVGLAVFAIVVFPIFWMISTAFKPDDEINSFTPTWFSTGPTLDHFRDAWPVLLLGDGQEQPGRGRRGRRAFHGHVAFLAAVALRQVPLHGQQALRRPRDRNPDAPAGRARDPVVRRAGRYTTDERAHGSRPDPSRDSAAVRSLDAAGPHRRNPKELEEVAMVDGSSRLGAFTRSCCLSWHRARRDVRVRLHLSWNEYIFANVILTDQANQTLTVWLSVLSGRAGTRTEEGSHGRVDADRDPRRDLLPHRAAEDRVRADGRRGQGMSRELERLASNCIFPGSRARRARLGAAARRRGARRRRPSTPGTSRAATSCGRSPTT